MATMPPVPVPATRKGAGERGDGMNMDESREGADEKDSNETK